MKRKWLINLRKDKNLTQQQVATLSFIDRGFYAQIEKGIRDPSIPVARKVAEVLSFNPAAFFSSQLDGLFRVALADSPIIVAHFDLNLKYTWSFNSHLDFNNDTIMGKTDIEVTNNEGTLQLMNLKKEVLEKQEPIRKTITFPVSDGPLIYDVFGAPLVENGSLTGGTTVSTDVTHILTGKKALDKDTMV
ncbi:helix-turn-helix domain-containing protein [Salipaludibacillus aurantiacus]|uniref:Helix-turn-helix n=1 Tax=Salipaludibacillus aurantiacus TaxID=1601833 RepID=A0A1H9VXT9_9BACI|nr:helix-turn-helix domain-containing protein [Salipaludibacillus aurantiacus]SES26475.1 Helix-turn-helix [Salipaludibacillus aurantiacus]